MGLLGLGVLAPLSAIAERVLSPDMREEEATHIVRGVVRAVEASAVENWDGIVKTTYTIHLLVESVEKGEQLDPADTIKVSCWRHTFIPEEVSRNPGKMEGAHGHRPIPGVGDSVRAFLQRDLGSWLVVYPTGFEILSLAEEEE